MLELWSYKKIGILKNVMKFIVTWTTNILLMHTRIITRIKFFITSTINEKYEFKKIKIYELDCTKD